MIRNVPVIGTVVGLSKRPGSILLTVEDHEATLYPVRIAVTDEKQDYMFLGFEAEAAQEYVLLWPPVTGSDHPAMRFRRCYGPKEVAKWSG